MGEDCKRGVFSVSNVNDIARYGSSDGFLPRCRDIGDDDDFVYADKEILTENAGASLLRPVLNQHA